MHGALLCGVCAASYPVIGGIPRFVPLENYASGFGFEWNQHPRTQYDETVGQPISETRFFEETGWDRDLSHRLLLEVGSGSGRFTEHAASTGAMVVSIDYSRAVEANYASNGWRPNVLIAQGDIYALPVPEAAFDRVLCIGVLQHTPAPEEAFRALLPFLKQDGSLVVDLYREVEGPRGLLVTKFWVRPLVKRVPPARLHAACERYIHAVWPLVRALDRLPWLGERIKAFLLVPDYRKRYGLAERHAERWAVLDLFDMLSPTYDYPQTLETVRRWFATSGLREWEVWHGYNGIAGRGTR